MIKPHSMARPQQGHASISAKHPSSYRPCVCPHTPSFAAADVRSPSSHRSQTLPVRETTATGLTEGQLAGYTAGCVDKRHRCCLESGRDGRQTQRA